MGDRFQLPHEALDRLLPIAEQIEAFPLRGEKERGQRLAFGNELMKWKDRVLKIADDLEVKVTLSPEKLKHAAQWRLIKVEPA